MSQTLKIIFSEIFFKEKADGFGLALVRKKTAHDMVWLVSQYIDANQY